MYDPSLAGNEQEDAGLSMEMDHALRAFVAPLLATLDRHMDRRLVRTVLATLEALICWRNRAHGLLLSELGAYILSPAHAPAGTKRLSNLLRSSHWSGAVIERFFWTQADATLERLEEQGDEACVAWDESVLEKPESRVAEGLSPVRSSKAGRLMARKPGYTRPPGPPVFVPGFHWLSLLLVGTGVPPALATMRWWRTRGEQATTKRTEEEQVLRIVAKRWGGRVLHLWDRGFAGTPWLTSALGLPVRFVLRWPKGYLLQGADGEHRPAWKHLRGKRAWDERLLWDGRKRRPCLTKVLATLVWLPTRPEPLWLVVARRGQGQSPWYLLTNEHIETAEDAWHVVLAYARRWQIELVWRYSKSELALESPRLWTWERRLKLLLLASLAYAFLLSLLPPAWEQRRTLLLDRWCHRTGQRSRATPTPLYRLRSALSRLWLAFPPLALDHAHFSG
jgi:hypothetical protein